MKIALLIERFDQWGGGLEQWTWGLAHALAERGHLVTVLAFRAPAAAPSFVTLHLLPWHPSRLIRARTADAMVASLDLDVAHDLGIGCSSPLLHPQSGSRLANERREFLAGSPLRRLLAWASPRRRRWLHELREFENRRYAPPADSLVIAVSRMVADDLHAWHRVVAERIRLVPNGVDAGRFSKPEPAARERWRRHFNVGDKTVFLFSAHNPRLKGLLPLLEAFARVRHDRPDLVLMAIGREPDRETRGIVRRHRLQDAVIFPGLVADTIPCYAAADAFVLPSWHDACSLTVLEACACGLPVITTRSNGVADLLTDGREGRIIGSAGDIDALAASLEELSRPEVRQRMAVHAVETAARHDFQHNVDQVERVYDEVLHRKQHSAAGTSGVTP